MNRYEVYRYPLTMSDDTRLIEVFPPRRRAVNWAAVAAIAVLLVIDGGLLVSAILAWRHFR